MQVLANYFDPWHPGSKWARPEPHGLRKAAAPVGTHAVGKRGRTSPCGLAVVNKGKVFDEELALVKIDADVDSVVGELLQLLGVPEPPPYDKSRDPLLAGVVPALPGEPAAPWTIADALRGLR